MKNNLILTAVMSKLISDKDNILAQLDLILNKNTSDKCVAGVVGQTTELFIELSKIESTIETVKFVIDSNQHYNPITEQINHLATKITNLQEKDNSENHDNNS